MVVHIYTTKGFKEYFSNTVIRLGPYHNNTGPAFINYDANGNIRDLRWYEKGDLHRKDRPAQFFFYTNGNINERMYAIHGRIHCEIEPAYIQYACNGEFLTSKWYLRNIFIGYSYAKYKQYIFRNKIEYPIIYLNILKKEAIHIFD